MMVARVGDTVYDGSIAHMLHELAEKVRDRRAKLPRYRYVKCNNPACSRRVRVPYDSPVNEKTGCFTCNFGGFRDVGFMVPMSAKEAAEYDRDEETANRVWLEKREKADLYGTNEKLKAEGKEPITLEQLRAERQHYWKVQQEHTEKMGAKLRAANAEAKK